MTNAASVATSKTKHPRHVRAAIKAAKAVNPQVNESAPSFEDFLTQMAAAGQADRDGSLMGDDEDVDGGL